MRKKIKVNFQIGSQYYECISNHKFQLITAVLAWSVERWSWDWRARVRGSSLTKDHHVLQGHLVHAKSVVGGMSSKFPVNNTSGGTLA